MRRAAESQPKSKLPNPFPVYPVSSLREIAADILNRTVSTHAVIAVDDAVRLYAASVSAETREGLSLQVRGDYGTGKTHLLLYAEARLRDTLGATGSDVIVLSVPSTETEFGEWYLDVVAPLLVQLDLPKVFARVLAGAAAEIADEVALTRSLANKIRNDPLEVYRVLSEGLLSVTDVQRKYLSTISAVSPRASKSVRSVLASLAKPETAATALRWLAGQPIPRDDFEIVGVTRSLDADAEAASVLVAVAAAIAETGGVFALMIDEFEHLMSEDKRTGTHRNATTVKRMLEGMSGAKALVLVSGHWRAWEQLPDFQARFGGEAPVDLLTLTGEDIRLLAIQYTDWGERLSLAALDALSEASGRNIRRVMALLHQLYAMTFETSGSIDVEAVNKAVEFRRQKTEEAGDPGAVIGSMIETVGGQVTRDETLFGRLKFDFVGRFEDEVEFVANIRHMTTSADFTTELNDFAIATRALRSKHPEATGILVVSGAVEPSVLSLAEGIIGIKVLLGEGEGWDDALRQTVAATRTTGSVRPQELENTETVEHDEAAREQLGKLRVEHRKSVETTRGRLEQMNFGDDPRGVSATTLARSTAPELPASYFGGGVSALESFVVSIEDQKPTVLSFLLSPRYFPLALTCIFVGLAMIIFVFRGTIIVGDFYPFLFSHRLEKSGAGIEYPTSEYYSQFEGGALLFILIFLFLFVVMFIFTLVVWLSELRSFERYKRWGQQRLEEALVFDLDPASVISMKNQLIDAPEGAGSFRFAINHFERFGDREEFRERKAYARREETIERVSQND